LTVVGVVCALAVEARHLGSAARSRSRPEPTSLADGTLLIVSGMGGAAAAQAASALIAHGASALASFGLAGALDPALMPGAVFLPATIVDENGRTLETAPQWRERFARALSALQPLAAGRLLHSTRVVASVAEKAALLLSSGAAAVDMESFAVAQVACARGVPFLAVRVIVDGAVDSLPSSLSAAADGSGQLRLGRLMGAVARSPAQLADLLRLAQRYRAASRSLAAIARAGPLARYLP
jgi:adenosylhomocysteine nucleosidase